MRLFKRGILFSFMMAVMFCPVSTLADETGTVIEKQKETVGRVTLESKEYPLSHYRMEADIGDGLKETGDKALHAINEGLWGFNKTIASFSDYAVEMLMSFDLITMVASQAGVMSDQIYELMAGTFLSLFIVLAGGIAAWRYYVNGQSGHAVKALLGALVIMVFTFWFYEDTAGNITQLNQWGADLEGIASSANVMMTTENLDTEQEYDAQEGVAVLQNQMFNLMVKRPYLLLNYGTTNQNEVNSEDPNRFDSLLVHTPYDDQGNAERMKIVKDEVENLDNKQMSPAFSGERFGFLVITIVSTVALAIPIILLASFKFLLQVWFLALVIFTAVPLVLSLIPTYSETALNHFKKVIGVLLMKGGLVMLISVITGLITLLYESVKVTSGIEGYAFVVFMIVLVIWGLMKYRTEIFEVASASVIQGQQAAERMTFAMTRSAGDSGEKGMHAARRMTEGAFILGGKTRNFLFRSQQGAQEADVSPSKSTVRLSQASGHMSLLRSVPNTNRSADPEAKGVVQMQDFKKAKRNDSDTALDSKTSKSPSLSTSASHLPVSEARNPNRAGSEKKSFSSRKGQIKKMEGSPQASQDPFPSSGKQSDQAVHEKTLSPRRSPAVRDEHKTTSGRSEKLTTQREPLIPASSQRQETASEGFRRSLGIREGRVKNGTVKLKRMKKEKHEP